MELISYRGYTNDYTPENSKASILAAIKEGFKIIELDIRCTKDSEFIICHDKDLIRLFNFNSEKFIRDLTLVEIKNLTFKLNNAHLLTLKDILSLKDITFLLDIKDELNILEQKKLITLVREMGMLHRVMIYPYKENLRIFFNKIPMGIPLHLESQLDEVKNAFIIGMPHEWTYNKITRLHNKNKRCLTTLKKSYIIKMKEILNLPQNEKEIVSTYLEKLIDLKIDFLIIESDYFNMFKSILNR